MLLAWDNKMDAATLSAGSEINSLPVTNVQHEHVSRQWRTAATVKDSWLLADMLSSVTVGALAIVGTNLTASATVRVRASDADPQAQSSLLLDTGVIAAGVVANHPAVYYVPSNPVTARYWRIDITDTTVADNLHIGRVFAGPAWRPPFGRAFPFSAGREDDSERRFSRGGQALHDVRPQRRVMEVQLDFQSEAEMMNNALEVARFSGLHSDVLIIPNVDSPHRTQQSIWGLLRALQPVVHYRAQLWRTRYILEERL